jgi:hypothetical protein
MTPNPDFEHFVRDYVRLAGQERSLELRSRLLVLGESGCMLRCKTRQGSDHLAPSLALRSGDNAGMNHGQELV